MRSHSIILFLAILFLLVTPLMMSLANPSQCQLTIESAVGGTTVPSPGVYTYVYGANVTVTAVPDSGYIFDHWTDGSGHFIGGANPMVQTMYSNLTLQPQFDNISSAKRVLTINSGVNGTTNPSPGNYTYPYGTNVTITATPNSGYILDYWKGQNGNNMGNENPIMIMMNYNTTIEPVFENESTAKRTLNILAGNNGTTNPPPGNYTYSYMANATITAIPNSGYVFDCWMMGSGGNFGNQNPLKLTMNWNFTIQPIFENATSGPRTLMILSTSSGTTSPSPGTYTYNYGANVTITATPNSGQSFEHWILDGQTVNENPITLQMTQDHTLQPVFGGSQGNSGQSGKGFSLNIPPMFILAPAIGIMACCFIGYLVPLGLSIKKRKLPPSLKKPRLILALVSILIIVGPLGAALLVYHNNLGAVLTPSNTNKLTNMLSAQGGIEMPNVTSSWCNLTSQTFCLLFNFTNPTATNLTLIAYSANLMDHCDGYSMGSIALANPVTAGANETATFQMTSTLNEEATEHIATVHADESSFDVDLCDVNINYAGIILYPNGTSTVNNVSILR